MALTPWSKASKAVFFLDIKYHVKFFGFETCQFAKKHRNVYSRIVSKTSGHPFDLIQSDVLVLLLCTDIIILLHALMISLGLHGCIS